jgi:serine/threonine protein kinase/tetratricopeptide (TPR) repeat protein
MEERPDPDDATRALDPEAIERLIRSLREVGSNLGGWRIGSYRLVEEIGRGSMGIVFLARHETLRRDVALKVLPGSAALDPQSRERFLREARAMARIVHPGVVRIHDVIEDQGSLAIAMERVEGTSLAGLVAELRARRADGPPNLEHLAAALGTAVDQLPARSYVDWVTRVGRDLAEALQAVHDCELTHRDLKPSNVLVDRTGRALLADFGVVRDLDGSRTATGGFIGTAAYAAPEQLRGEPDVDSRADLYGLGATLYELLALAPPVSGSPATILGSIERGAVPPLRRRAVAPTTSSLALIVHHALEPERDRRYPTALAMAADLQACRESRPISVQAPTRLERIALWARREPTKARLAGILAVAALALVAVGGYLIAQLPRIDAERRREVARRVDELIATGRALDLWAPTLEAAQRALEEALALDPDQPIALGMRAMQLARVGRPEAARALLASRASLVEREAGLRGIERSGVELFRSSPTADRALLEGSAEPLECFFAGLAFAARAAEVPDPDLQRAQFGEASALLQRALLLSEPVPQIFRIELALAAASARLPTTARDQLAILEPAWTGAPGDDSPSIAVIAVWTLLQLGDAEAALEICATAALRNSDPDVHALLHAKSLSEAGRADEARTLLAERIGAGGDPFAALRIELERILPEDDPRRAALGEEIEAVLADLVEKGSVQGFRRSRVLLEISRRRWLRIKGFEQRIEFLRDELDRTPDDWQLRLEHAVDLLSRCRQLAHAIHLFLPDILDKLADRTIPTVLRAVPRILPHREGIESIAPEAFENLRIVGEQVPFHPAVALNAALAWSLLRADDEAGFAHFDRLEQVLPGSPLPGLFRGLLSLRLGRRADAIAQLARACELVPGRPSDQSNPFASYSVVPDTLLGWLLLDEGRFGEAERHLDRGLELAALLPGSTDPRLLRWRRNAWLGKAVVALRTGTGPAALEAADPWIARAADPGQYGRHAFGLDDAVAALRDLVAEQRDDARRHLADARRGLTLAAELGSLDPTRDALLPRNVGLIDEIEAALGR